MLKREISNHMGFHLSPVMKFNFVQKSEIILLYSIQKGSYTLCVEDVQAH